MPEADEAIQGTQDPNATTPATERDQPTTVKTSEKSGSSDKGLMDLLDIPPEVQSRIAGKAESGKLKAEKGEPEPEKAAGPEGPTPRRDEEPEELKPDEDEEEAEDEQPAAAEEKVDKRQKRINRLTRKKAELEDQLDKFATENQRLRQEAEKRHGQQPGWENQPAPLAGGQLPAIEQQIAAQDAILGWCDRNSEGGELGQGEKAQYIDGQGVRDWRRDAEAKRQELVLDRRVEAARLTTVRDQADRAAYELCPEMFDKTKPEYQEAVAILRQYPFMVAIPEANVALAQLLEGRKSIRARKNGAQRTARPTRDIDERVFTTPRVPIAPHTSEPPTRESTPSSQKQLNEARSRMIKDTDGSTESLANVFAAMEKAQRTSATSRSPVRS
jgi:hypothetical protein